MSTKKNLIEENTLLDVSDAELAEFSGGGLAGGLLDTVGQTVPPLQTLTDSGKNLLGGTDLHTNTQLNLLGTTVGVNTPKDGLLGGSGLI
jgi:hypothetical protein